MSVSHELLCSFELLKPLDSSALKSHIKKGRNKRASGQGFINSPVSHISSPIRSHNSDQGTNIQTTARKFQSAERIEYVLYANIRTIPIL